MSGVVGMRSSKALALPSWSEGYIRTMDLRCAPAQRIVRSMEQLCDDVTRGELGKLSYRQWIVIERIAHVEERSRRMEQDFLSDSPTSFSAYTQLMNALSGLLRTLGSMTCKEERVVSIQDYIKGDGSQ